MRPDYTQRRPKSVPLSEFSYVILPLMFVEGNDKKPNELLNAFIRVKGTGSGGREIFQKYIPANDPNWDVKLMQFVIELYDGLQHSISEPDDESFVKYWLSRKSKKDHDLIQGVAAWNTPYFYDLEKLTVFTMEMCRTLFELLKPYIHISVLRIKKRRGGGDSFLGNFARIYEHEPTFADLLSDDAVIAGYLKKTNIHAMTVKRKYRTAALKRLEYLHTQVGVSLTEEEDIYRPGSEKFIEKAKEAFRKHHIEGKGLFTNDDTRSQINRILSFSYISDYRKKLVQLTKKMAVKKLMTNMGAPPPDPGK